MIAFHQPDLQKRILCSAVSIRSQNLQLALGYLAVGCSVWMLTTWIPAFFFYRKAFFQSPKMPYYMLNSLPLLLVGLALSFLLGTFITKEDILTALVNVVTLGMSFLCGVLILSRLVDTFFSRISPTMQLPPKHHSIAYVLPWAEGLHWQSRSSGCSNS